MPRLLSKPLRVRSFAEKPRSMKAAQASRVHATLRFDGKGPLNAKQRQGILTQIFNILF